jgi:thiamine kinase-like enzyme
MTAEIEQARDALARLPQFQGVDREAVAIERLGGLTNLVFRVDAAGERYCLRIAGKGTEDYIDRKVEAHNARVAARAGVSAEVLFFDQADGLMLTRFIGGTTTMTPESFIATPGAPARAARAFRQLHDCGETFQFRFELFAMIDDYLGTLAKRGAELPEGYHDAVKEAEAVRQALDAHPARLAPCHCDPLSENFLDDGRRMWIVDWEYSGMNDPIWDLGDLSVEAGFGEAEDREMMAAYCGEAVPRAVYGRMIIYKAMCDLLWTLWGLIQHSDDNPADDFWAYSVNRFERCKALMGQHDFADHLAAVSAGRD